MQQGTKKLQWCEYLKLVFLEILNPLLCWVFANQVTIYMYLYLAMRMCITYMCINFYMPTAIQGGRAIVHWKAEMEMSINSPIHTPRMTLNSENETTVNFKFEVLFVVIASGVLPDDQNHFDELINSMSPESGYFVCQGIPYSMNTIMAFQTKSVRKWDLPFQQLDHKECKIYINFILFEYAISEIQILC